MQDATEYLDKTRSAAVKLLEGIETYLSMLRGHSTFYMASYTQDEEVAQQKYDAWYEQNRTSIQAALDAQKQYNGETFAQATLCGSLLQLAAKAIECYSKNSTIPHDWQSLIKPKSKAVPFCIGRLVRGVPLGLVIYAGRNQHTHYDDLSLREPNVEVFRRLAMNHGYGKGRDEPVIDGAFHLRNESITSFASNITALIEWRSMAVYEADMKNLLGV